MNIKIVSTGLLAGLVAGTGAGLILQDSGFAGASSVPAAVVVVDDTTATEAANTEPARPDIGGRLRDVLQPLVDDGTLTSTQLDAVVSTMEAARPADDGGRRGRGPRGDHGRRGMNPDVIASTLGITADELRAELIDGATVADVAAANGVDVQTVIDAVIADATSKIAERVASGDMTQERADKMLADLEARVTDMVNNVRPERPGPHSGPQAGPEADTDTGS